MVASVIVWDIETVPDIKSFAAANGHDGKSDDEIRVAMGDEFPKHIYHSMICIGALSAHEEDGRWAVDALGTLHVGERSEKALISSFVDRIAQLTPQLVTFNGASFDLPALRYRAMVHGIAAPGLSSRPYFNRYAEDAAQILGWRLERAVRIRRPRADVPNECRDRPCCERLLHTGFALRERSFVLPPLGKQRGKNIGAERDGQDAGARGKRALSHRQTGTAGDLG